VGRWDLNPTPSGDISRNSLFSLNTFNVPEKDMLSENYRFILSKTKTISLSKML
jgi:hypothetical protein